MIVGKKDYYEALGKIKYFSSNKYFQIKEKDLALVFQIQKKWS